jgi:hypothetical protein
MRFGSPAETVCSRTVRHIRLSHYLLLLGCIGALSGLLGGCTDNAVPRQTQTVDGVTITFSATDPPRLNTAEEFIITLTDAQGRPIDTASVYLDLTMPAMPMGTNRPIAESLGAGDYRAYTAYTMTGLWEIAVIAEIDNREYRAVFTRDLPE